MVVGGILLAVVVTVALRNAPYVLGWPPARAAVVGGGPVEMHYAPQEDLEAIDVELIDGAGVSIDMAAYVLTDAAVIEALDLAASRGVKIRLYRWPGEHEPGSRATDALAQLAAEPGFEQRFKKGPDLMHLKSYCIDGALLRGGAANFSRSGLTKQDNDLDVFRGPGICARFEQAFEAMWREAR
jgi:phosphatidylserine/phosphatidylglycerophosphate/cardiolipin synthase-like enzyme